MSDQMTETFQHQDLILPILPILGYSCDVRVVIDDQYVRLYIGPRDWQWERQTGKFIGAGTALESNCARP